MPDKTESKVKKRKVKKYSTKFLDFMRKLLGPLVRLLFRVRVANAEKLPENGRLIVCSNHISYLDPVILMVVFNRPINFIGKKQLFRVPVLNWLLMLLGVIPIDRTNPDREVFRATTAILEKENVIGIFPEGTRTKDGALHEGKHGVGMLVARGKSPVLPCALYYPNGAGLFKKSFLVFGDLIPEEELITQPGKAGYGECADKVMHTIAKLDAERLYKNSLPSPPSARRGK